MEERRGVQIDEFTFVVFHVECLEGTGFLVDGGDG